MRNRLLLPTREAVQSEPVNLTLQTALPEHLPLAASPQLAENSRLGFATNASTLRWASGFSISSSTLGLSASLYDGRVGSRSTGKERDSESGNDYFDARYYSSAMGRFMSPDWAAKASPVPYATFGDPQSLNLYAYVRNNPLTRVDADGHCCEDGSTADRLLTLTVGTINLYVSVNKGLGAVAEAATAETGVGALVALYTGNQAVNQGAGGIRQIFGAFTGNTKDANDYADNLTIHSSLLGAGALLVTKNKDLALGAAAAEGIASTTVVKKLPEVIDAGMNALQVLTSAKPNAPAQPPPQPAPPAPPQPPPPPPPPQKPPAQ